MSSSSDGRGAVSLMEEENSEKYPTRWPRNWILGVTVFFLYGVSIWILLKFLQYSVSYDTIFPFNPFRINKVDILDEINIDCNGVIKGNSSVIEKLKSWKLPDYHVEERIEKSADQCSVINELFLFNKRPLSDEEANFPLAYGLVVYKQITQVLLMLSSFYQPQNLYCVAVSGSAQPEFKKIANILPKCFPNIHILNRPPIQWGSFEIINSTYACLNYLSNQDHDWQYFQYLSGVDIALKTNWEMVQILKAINGNVNVEFKEYEPQRSAGKNISKSPLPLYKSSLSPIIPRTTADYICNTSVTKKLLKFLQGTRIPDESFWATLTGNVKTFPIPGGFDADSMIKIRKKLQKEKKEEKGVAVNHIRWSYYFSRNQIWMGSKCFGKMASGSCVYGVKDVSTLMKQPHLVAHKFYIGYQPAGYICALKEIRRRSYAPVPFDTTTYADLPQYELMSGVAPENLTHPTWL